MSISPLTCCSNEEKNSVLCLLSRGRLAPSRKKVNFIRTVLDITQNNNIAVRCETHSHQSEFDRCGDRHISGNMSGQAEPHDVYMTVLKAPLQGIVPDQTDVNAGP